MFTKSNEYTCLFLEITRILNHLLAILLTVLMLERYHLFWAFEEREKLILFMKEYLEHVCIQALYVQGALHSIYIWFITRYF